MTSVSEDLRDALLGDFTDLKRAENAVAEGADVNISCFIRNERMPLLHAVILMNDTPALRFLLKQPDLNINATDGNGFNALMVVVMNHGGPLDATRFGEIVDMLLDAGISLDHKDNDGDTIFNYTSAGNVAWLHAEKKKRLEDACLRAKEKRWAQGLDGETLLSAAKPGRVRKFIPRKPG